MIDLDKRPLKIHGNMNGRAEKNGDEPIPCLDVYVTFFVTREEVNTISGGTHVAEALFDHSAAIVQPHLKQFAPLKLKGKFKGSSAALTVGLDATVFQLPNIKIASVTLTPQSGGMTALKCRLSMAATIDNIGLILWMDREGDIEARLGALEAEEDEAQQELPLAVAETAEDVEQAQLEAVEDARAAPKRRGRPPKAHGADALN